MQEVIGKVGQDVIKNCIDEAIKELKIKINDNKINATDAQKIVEYVSKNCDVENKILNANAELKETKGGISGILFAAMLVCGGGYGGYKIANDHRYPVEKEYAFISTCVGEYGRYNTKSYCIEKLKKCQGDGKTYSQCY